MVIVPFPDFPACPVSGGTLTWDVGMLSSILCSALAVRLKGVPTC